MKRYLTLFIITLLSAFIGKAYAHGDDHAKKKQKMGE